MYLISAVMFNQCLISKMGNENCVLYVVVRTDFTNVMVVTLTLFHSLNNLIKFDVLLKKHSICGYSSEFCCASNDLVELQNSASPQLYHGVQAPGTSSSKSSPCVRKASVAGRQLVMEIYSHCIFCVKYRWFCAAAGTLALEYLPWCSFFPFSLVLSLSVANNEKPYVRCTLVAIMWLKTEKKLCF